MKEHEEYNKKVEKQAKDFRLSSEDLHNLFDLLDMISPEYDKTLELNNMLKWFNDLYQKIGKIIVPEVYGQKEIKK
jgi:DNA replicative helicase MCM subunit Mcm2 (Cdc46/Mcm family)